MVKGESIIMIMDFVTKKRGVDGLRTLIDRVNESEILFTKAQDIKSNENYPAKYMVRVLNAAQHVLNSESLLKDMGSYFANNINMSFKGVTGKYPPKKSVQQMVIYAREYLPIFHTGYRTMSDNTYWIRVTKISDAIYPFIDGFFTGMFEKHGGVVEVKRYRGESSVKYILKF